MATQEEVNERMAKARAARKTNIDEGNNEPKSTHPGNLLRNWIFQMT